MKRRPILLAVALLLALIGTGAVYLYVHTADSRAANGLKATTVLVVTKEIPVGTTWSSVAAGGYVTTESVPVSAAPSSALASTTADVTSTDAATFAIPTGQILVRQMFATKPAATGALAIPGKLQALSIALPSNADVSGFVQPGSQVAVYSVHQLTRSTSSGQQIGQNPFASKLLLPRIAVLAVSQAAPTTVNGSGASPANAVLVTLAVSQEDAERIVLAQKVGDLYLSLLSDSSATAVDGGTLGVGFFNPTPLFTR